MAVKMKGFSMTNGVKLGLWPRPITIKSGQRNLQHTAPEAKTKVASAVPLRVIPYLVYADKFAIVTNYEEYRQKT